MQLAGINSMTVAPDLLRTLSKTEEPESCVVDFSVFKNDSEVSESELKRMTFIDNETMYRRSFAESNGCKGPDKTTQVQRFRTLYELRNELTISRRSASSVTTRAKQRH